jgi:hypothetical protein
VTHRPYGVPVRKHRARPEHRWPLGLVRSLWYAYGRYAATYDSEQYLRAREAEAMCDHVWIFEC